MNNAGSPSLLLSSIAVKSNDSNKNQNKQYALGFIESDKKGRVYTDDKHTVELDLFELKNKKES